MNQFVDNSSLIKLGLELKKAQAAQAAQAALAEAQAAQPA